MWLTSQIRCTPRLDEEEYGGHQLLLMEGLMPGIAVFLVCPHTLCSHFALLSSNMTSNMSETQHQLIFSCGPASHWRYVCGFFKIAMPSAAEVSACVWGTVQLSWIIVFNAMHV